MNGTSKDTKMMVFIAVLVVFAAYYFLIKPQQAGVAQARSDRAAVEQSVSDAEAMLLNADPDIDDGLSTVDAEALASAVPPGEGLADLLRQLKAVADETGLVHSSIAPSAVTDNPFGTGGSIQIAITAAGSHDAARAYLAELRGMPRLVLIEQIGLHVAADQSAQLQLSLRVFTQSTPSVAAR